MSKLFQQISQQFFKKLNWKQSLLLVALLSAPPLQTLQSAEIGEEVSSCVLEQLSKTNQHNLKNLENDVIYLDFWASWCPPCAKSFPFLNELHSSYQSDGLKVVAINLDENIEDAKKFLARFPADFPVALDFSKQCAKELGILAMPSSYLIDRQGVIRHIHLGFRSSQAPELRRQVEQLLSKSMLSSSSTHFE